MNFNNQNMQVKHFFPNQILTLYFIDKDNWGCKWENVKKKIAPRKIDDAINMK